MDYELLSPLAFNVEGGQAAGRFCVAFITEDDSVGEGTEQFELYFENLPSEFYTAGDPDRVCVSIIDNDGMPIHSIANMILYD